MASSDTSKIERRLETLYHHLTPSLSHTPASLSFNSPFQYTQGSGSLSLAERSVYEEQGYVVVKGLVPVDDLEKYATRFDQIVNGDVDNSELIVMKDVSQVKDSQTLQTVNKVQGFQSDPILSQYLRTPQVLDCVESIIGDNIAAMHSMLINKPPDPGTKSSRHPLHQDLHYFSFRPANKIVASWTAMQWVHRGNGCLVVVPGSHKPNHLYPHNYPNWSGGVNKMYYGIPDEEVDKYYSKLVHLEMNAGDTVFFHPLIIHGSGTNKTDGFRKAISGHFANTDCYYIRVDGTTQQMLQDEIKSLAIKRHGKGIEVSLTDVWKLRKLLVRGKDDARVFIKTNFAIYRQLLNKKEFELLSELNQLEETNKPELLHVNADIKQLTDTIETIEDNFTSNSMQVFLEQEKCVWNKQILDLTRCQKLLSNVTINCPEFDYFENIIQIIPFWPKSKFSKELEPILNYSPQINEEWFIVSKKWFSEIENSINLNNPQPNDSWEFPTSIPIDQSDIYVNGQIQNPDDCMLLHSKAWNMLLRFNGLSPGSVPIKRRTYLKNLKIEVPIAATQHQCSIGYHSGDQNFSFNCEIRLFPYNTYQDLLQRISGFISLFTGHDPILYSHDCLFPIYCNIQGITNYKIERFFLASKRPMQLTNLTSQIGNKSKHFLIIIPDSFGMTKIRASKKGIHFMGLD
ncbi:Phytanoyl-CoA dioxygenase, peroxisomal isoform X1 [Oopsacas minuta]|uniref:phytanoyl-CoA dioxygenase n=1 Tax=Oopsacas minuta TaxID=111878 RepID=A0AAV7JWU2_9METZ|nr:Phytanoyl-CoA dioxygenase, peroxisomal isoform X1 [Oopsacas minuta]